MTRRRGRRRREAHEEDEHFWPGYVDAITNVVINLLFLIAIFVLAILVVSTGKGAAERLDSSPKGQLVNVNQPDKAKQALAKDKIQISETQGEGYRTIKVRLRPGFDITDLSDADLKSYISLDDARITKKINVWASAGKDNLAQRKAFFFIHRVVNYLVASGIKREIIFTNIYETDGDDASSRREFNLLFSY